MGSHLTRLESGQGEQTREWDGGQTLPHLCPVLSSCCQDPLLDNARGRLIAPFGTVTQEDGSDPFFLALAH